LSLVDTFDQHMRLNLAIGVLYATGWGLERRALYRHYCGGAASSTGGTLSYKRLNLK
jgi:hypothetical protein